MRWFHRVLIAIPIGLLLIAALLLWMVGGWQSPRKFSAPIEQLAGATTETSTSTSQLDVVVWNLAWGYGWGSEGTGAAKPRAHFEARLERMVSVLEARAPDLVLLQEVDFDSDRSHRIDQARFLAERLGLRFIAKAESWRANYLPFPYWPPRDHFGRIRSGGAVLSRFPIVENVVDLYPKPEENSFFYNLGYLFRYLQRVTVEVDGARVPVFNAHTDAFSASNRQAHAGHIARQLTEAAHPMLVFGGDMNTVPPESTTRSGYPDEPGTSHEDDATIHRLRAVEGLEDALSEEAFTSNEASFFTFPAHEPNRKLDFLFCGEAYGVSKFEVLAEAGDVSDHLPILATLAIED